MHGHVFFVSNLGFLKQVSTDEAYDVEMLPQYNIPINNSIIFRFLYICLLGPPSPQIPPNPTSRFLSYSPS